MKFSGDGTELESKGGKTFDLAPSHYAARRLSSKLKNTVLINQCLMK